MNLGVVYVLSLPSFHWQKQQYTPDYGRYQHSCNVVGNRQMVVVGGLIVPSNAPYGSVGTIRAPDPWPQGLGIFDLSAMEWSASYNPDAASYVTPTSVKEHIAQNGRYPSKWSDPMVETWLKESKLRQPATDLHDN